MSASARSAALLILIGVTLIAGGVWQVRNGLRHGTFNDADKEAGRISYRQSGNREPMAFWLNLGLRALSIPVGIWVIVEAIASVAN
jgi:uncharacterized membrane protein HdeD (DUF308 family)